MNILTIRKHKRFAVRRKANLVSPGNRPKPGLLVEVSLEGCRMGIAGCADFAVGQQVKVRIAGFGDFRAEVRWAGQGFVGMHFVQALHHAELNELIRACRPEYAGDTAMRACA
jgi:hypothetical protein